MKSGQVTLKVFDDFTHHAFGFGGGDIGKEVEHHREKFVRRIGEN